jgi:N-acetylglucosamine kinase-like BadF-type ATPase
LITATGNSQYLLGIDTGSSKTHALVSTLTGEAVGFGESGSGNYEVVGLDGLIKAMQQAIGQAVTMAGINKKDILSMGFGLSGYDWPSERGSMMTAIESLGIAAPYDFVNDAVIGLIAGAREGWGVAVDAGTGNNVRGRSRDGRMGRITGNSASFGEFGGAGELVWRAIIAVTYAWTKRGPRTRLTEAFMEFASLDSEDALIEHLAMRKIALPPSLAVDVFRLAAEGDQVAREVINWTAKELGLNVNAVIRQIGLESMVFDVVLIGSLFKAGEAYITPLRRTIHDFAPGANLIRLSVPPVVGSVLLAAETIQAPTAPIRQELTSTTRELFAEFSESPENAGAL